MHLTASGGEADRVALLVFYYGGGGGIVNRPKYCWKKNVKHIDRCLWMP